MNVRFRMSQTTEIYIPSYSTEKSIRSKLFVLQVKLLYLQIFCGDEVISVRFLDLLYVLVNFSKFNMRFRSNVDNATNIPLAKV